MKQRLLKRKCVRRFPLFVLLIWLVVNPFMRTTGVIFYGAEQLVGILDEIGEGVSIIHHRLRGVPWNHVDLSVNGTVFSFAPFYNARKGGIVAPAALLEASKDEYLMQRFEQDVTSQVTFFQLDVRQEQVDALYTLLREYMEKGEFNHSYLNGTVVSLNDVEGLEQYHAWHFNCIHFIQSVLIDVGIYVEGWTHLHGTYGWIGLTFPWEVYQVLDQSYQPHFLTRWLSSHTRVLDTIGVEVKYIWRP